MDYKFPIYMSNQEFIDKYVELPSHLERFICLCSTGMNYREGFHASPDSNVFLCGTCKGTSLWNFSKCIDCDIYFVKDFTHPAYCYQHAQCWNCVGGEVFSIDNYEACCDLKQVTRYRKHLRILPPVGLNPKTYSQEEVSDTLAELGIKLDFL